MALAEFEVDGKIQQVNIPDGLSPEQAEDFINRGIGQAGFEAIQNISQSAVQFGKNVVGAVTSPVETAQGLGRVAYGAAQHAFPNAPLLKPEALGVSPETAERSKQEASALAEGYRQRYGGWQNVKHTLATDPVGMMSDVSAVLNPIAAAAGAVPKAGKLASMLRTGEKITNPITVPVGAFNLGGTLVSEGLGKLTGVGGETVRNALRAGLEGKTAFWKNLTNQADFDEVVSVAKEGLAKMRQERNAEYQTNMANIKADKTVLGFDDIDQGLAKAKELVGFEGQTYRKKAAGYLQEVENEINRWRNLDPAKFHTAEGMDKLKQAIGEIIDTIPQENAKALGPASEVYNSIGGTIRKQAPEYDKVMRSYSDMNETIRELEKSLSLRKWDSVDTAMRKLQSLTRDNVNTNYGNRLQLAKELEKRGADVIPAVAGQAMSSWTPRGIQGATLPTQAGIAGYAGGPMGVAATLGASSPKLVGATTYGAGLVAGLPSRTVQMLRGALPSSVESKLPVITPARRKALVNYLNQMSANNPNAGAEE